MLSLLFGVFLCTGCQNTETTGRQWDLFGQKQSQPTTVINNLYVLNGSAGAGVPSTQPVHDMDSTVQTSTSFQAGHLATASVPSGRYVQVTNINLGLGTNTTASPTGTQNGSMSQSSTPTQTTETKAGVNAALQVQGIGQQQSTQAGSGEGNSGSAAAPQSANPSVGVNTGRQEPSTQPAG